MNRSINMARLLSLDLPQALILLFFSLPLFFQLSGTVYNAADAVFDSQGNLLRLPLPIAAIFCFVGIALLLRIGDSYFGSGFVFSFFMLMMLSAIVSTSHDGGIIELAKFIHLVQFVLPTLALVLGGLYLKPASLYLRFEAVLLYVLIIIIPLQIAASIDSGNVLAAKLYFFSLYQHYQYLPVIFCGFYLLAAACFFERSHLRTLVVLLAPCMGIYIAQSLSISALVLAAYGAIVLIGSLYRKKASRFALLLMGLVIAAHLIYSPFVEETSIYPIRFGQVVPIPALDAGDKVGVTTSTEGKSGLGSYPDLMMQSFSRGLEQRAGYWRFYVAEIVSTPTRLVFGHSIRLDSSQYPGAHNYYLGLAYNFGVISLLPFLYLIIVSISRFRKALMSNNNPPDLIMLAALVAFFIFIDNFFKVGFSQPYPGMMMFFLWGVLLARLDSIDTASRQEIDP